MIWFFTPYAFNKKLFEAYDMYMQTIADPNDWGCLMDGDMAFLISDFGTHLQEYIDKYPGTGLFISYASRSPYGHQMKPGVNPESDSIKYVFENTQSSYINDHLKAIEQTKRICAPLLLIQKRTWIKYRDGIAEQARAANIQAVDTAISDNLMKAGEKILLMAGVQVYHYYRHYSRTEKHILSDKLTVVIRTHSRPTMFERCITSVLKQTHPNIEIVVGVDNQESYDYAIQSPAKVIRVKPVKKTSDKNFPANGYISELIEGITDGYILVLDDDAYLPDPLGVEKLFAQMDKEYCLYIIRYRHPNGNLFPNDRQFRNRVIEDGGIDWGSFVFHARFAKVTQSKPVYNADFYFATELNRYIRESKWIDLALVHTDTPGMNGKTEKEIKLLAPIVRTKPIKVAPSDGKTIDVVYVLGTGSNWANNELRFSLRSIETYGINVGKIFVVGTRPDFLSEDVIHIEATDIYNPTVNADGNIAHKVWVACADERLSDNFLFINDDHILLQEMDLGNIPAYHKGDMNTYPETFWGMNYWRTRLQRTMETLNRNSLTAYNYDCHTPIVFNKKLFTEVMAPFPIGEGKGLTMKSLYGNVVYGDTGQQLDGEKQTVFANYTTDQLNNRLERCQFMAFNDSGLNPSLKVWLYNRFAEISRWETTDLSDRYIEIARWLAGPRDFKEGAALFEKYLSGANLIKMFKAGEREYLRKKLEFKLIHSISDL